MADAIGCIDRLVILWQNPLKTAQIDAGFGRVASALMVGVDAARPAKIVPCRRCSPSVASQAVRALQDFDAVSQRGNGSSTASAAKRAIAPGCCRESTGQIGAQNDGAAMTTGAPDSGRGVFAHRRVTFGMRLSTSL